MTEPREEVLAEGIRIFLGDCREVLPMIGRVDAVVTDPPYGIGYKSSQPNAIDYGPIIGDDGCFDPGFLLSFPLSIIWGANNFSYALPRGGWLVWDKRVTEAADRMMGSPFELAWISDAKKFRIARIQHGGAKNADAINGDVANEARVHPTQKPVRLMEFCLDLLPYAETICDPFLGSGTTGVACVNLGRKFIGIEREPKYYEIAKRRITEALKQPRLPLDEPKRAVQTSLLDAEP